MKKQILNLGEVLSKKEQKNVLGGFRPLDESDLSDCKCWVSVLPYGVRCLSTTKTCAELHEPQQ